MKIVQGKFRIIFIIWLINLSVHVSKNIMHHYYQRFLSGKQLDMLSPPYFLTTVPVFILLYRLIHELVTVFSNSTDYIAEVG
jgi:hypothetical protein